MTEIKLRGFQERDVDVVQNLWSDYDTALLIKNRVSLPSQAAVLRYFNCSDSSENRVIVADTSDQPIGYVCYRNICPVSRTYEIGLSLLPSVRGQGVGSISLRLLESFLSSQWKAHKILAEVLDINKVSQRLFMGSQYRHIGTKQSHFLIGEAYHDVLLYEKILK